MNSASKKYKNGRVASIGDRVIGFSNNYQGVQIAIVRGFDEINAGVCLLQVMGELDRPAEEDYAETAKLYHVEDAFEMMELFHLVGSDNVASHAPNLFTFQPMPGRSREEHARLRKNKRTEIEEIA